MPIDSGTLLDSESVGGGCVAVEIFKFLKEGANGDAG